MKPKRIPRSTAALVVGTAHTARGLREAGRLRRADLGVVEVRLDSLASVRGPWVAAVDDIRPRILLTTRHPAEGGAPGLQAAKREALMEAFLRRADAIDVELRSVSAMSGLLDAARRRKLACIVSFHDFDRTPAAPRLRRIVRDSIQAGADIVKVATHVRGPADLAVLLDLQSSAKVPLATMGMGPWGKVSRLVLAAAGSRLNYGYLDKPQVAGQWPALELVRRLGEVMP